MIAIIGEAADIRQGFWPDFRDRDHVAAARVCAASWCAPRGSVLRPVHWKFAFKASPFCITLQIAAAMSAELTTRYRGGAQGGVSYEAQNRIGRTRCDSSHSYS